MNCIKIGLPGNWFSVRENVFWKNYFLENSHRESIFREDLFLYNCLQDSAESVERPPSEDELWVGHVRFAIEGVAQGIVALIGLVGK